MKDVKRTETLYEQPMHSCGNPDKEGASLRLRVMDAGGGDYLVMDATEFAMESLDDIEALARLLREHLPKDVKAQSDEQDLEIYPTQSEP